MTNLPKRTTHYLGPITDTDRWDQLDIRDDDVFVCTPPKSGTTWSQSIVCMMIQGRPDFKGGLVDISPWLESSTRPMEDVNAGLEKQTHRRCIKSHSPLDGVPYREDVTYIAVYRHPLDVHFSMRNHAANMAQDKLDHLFKGDPRSDALRFISDTPPLNDCDYLTLHTLTTHYNSYKQWEHLPNVHLFHYADMCADLPATIARFSDILGYNFDAKLLSDFVQAADFDTMRKTPERFVPSAGLGIFKDETAFFKSAKAGKWEKHLNSDDLILYQSRLEAFVGMENAKWLNYGSPK